MAFQAVSADRHLTCRVGVRQAGSLAGESGKMPDLLHARLARRFAVCLLLYAVDGQQTS